jgi:uncharacterized membrane-anchored protein
MKGYYLVILFGLMCVSQWYVPVAMIAEQEDILANGKVFRFETEPVDPSDPFRGKYITLNFKADSFKQYNGGRWERGQKVFVVLGEDDDGFARIADLLASSPASEMYYIEVKVSYTSDEMVQVVYPFERFYLEESKALEAEHVYRDVNRNDSSQTAYALVRIKNGKPALEDVMINDRSIVDIVRDLQERAQ